MLEALSFPFFQRALATALLASVACGVIGTYVVVKRISSISGGLSHAAFGGVGLGYWLGFSPILGATGFTLAAGAGLGWAYRRLPSGFDTLISMVWAVGMALGILFVALTPGYAPDLMSYLFGSILFVPASDVWGVAALDGVVLLGVFFLFDEFQAISFDEEFAEVAGLPVGLLFQILLALTSLAIVTLIRVAGVILVIALLTIPAATARQWTTRLRPMMCLATLLSAACSVAGLFLAYDLSDRLDLRLPSGPLIILLAVALFGVSSAARAIWRPRKIRGGS